MRLDADTSVTDSSGPPISMSSLDPRASALSHFSKKWFWLILLWTLPALPSLLLGSVNLPGARFFPAPAVLENPGLLAYSLLYWYFWIPITPKVPYLAARFPILDRGRVRSWNLVRHAFFGLVAGVGFEIYRTLLGLLCFDWSVVDPFAGIAFRMGEPGFGVWLFLKYFESISRLSGTYWLVLFGASSWNYYWRGRDRERQLTEARLTTLKAQIHPHFLFNTLHSVSTLMEDDVAGARKALARLSDLLRASLAEPPGATVGLAEELEIARLYLDIEKVRFGDRLEIEVDIDEATRDAAVPHLLLQPLVENAIRHGIGGRTAAGSVAIRSRVEGETLRIDIDDDGPGLSPADREAPGSAEGGIGLTNARARLEQLYGDRASIELGDRPGGGCRSTVRLPYETMEPIVPGRSLREDEA